MNKKVQDEQRMIQQIMDNFPEIKHDSYYYSSTGGLKAIAWKNKYGHITSIELEFVLTSWESDGDYYDDDLQMRD